ncbi:tRNA pseudouridine(38-40) synthase TruA [Calycomorphotria hydatis]|uniref:tRNA pseudouridine synthase A n=1 Tax=Calycomorphotria hydatis TaxID=2528027 RepID=A0A517T570_9PLAN|nr:tRNA pseudouridine(38-40) synthase TruA [Calycomorphotria hydatis]QDT63520.1 tRNA pseudouridine synthase A [Calycomorphotria hydatis]
MGSLTPNRNILLTLAYDGTRFAGWQVQPELPTIQSELQAAVKKLTGEDVVAVSSGRTDAGVHALGQVANFRTACTIPPLGIQRGLNQHLPDEIAVLEADDVPYDFHASFWAVRKTYRYVIDTNPTRNPFLRNYAWNVRRELNLEEMQAGANEIRGTHDFRCFETQGSPRSDTIRTIERCLVLPAGEWALHSRSLIDQSTGEVGPFVVIEVTGNGFLYNMVRAIAGTLYQVGYGKKSVDDVHQLIAAQDRTLAGPTAPAAGLYLVSVEYGDGPVQRNVSE